ncbi:hypothetical protein WJX73_009862 [Symbiochloris irregularis]|uniref:Uncharacterized protein n=1 Tax=Symbiochloris irregularis TaxID=706552 RepID=A0AAW1NVD1_9CHLO
MAQVATEAQSSNPTFEGLLFGRKDTLVTESLTDSDEKQTKVRIPTHITGACKCGKPCTWFTTSGKLQEELLEGLIAEYVASGQDFIGWFSCREAAAAAYMPTARERAVCSRLLQTRNISEPLLYGLFYRDALHETEPLGFYLELYEAVHSTQADHKAEPPCQLNKVECTITNVGGSRAQAVYRNVSSFSAILPTIDLMQPITENKWTPKSH